MKCRSRFFSLRRRYADFRHAGLLLVCLASGLTLVPSADAQTASILDTTRGEGGYIVDGDYIEYQITGLARITGQPVTYDWTYNGQYQGNFPFNSNTNGTGTWTWGPARVGGGLEGAWLITLRVNGVAISPTLSFQIAAAVPGITQQNITRGGTNFMDGDTVKDNIASGFPNAPVTLSYSVNGVNYGPVSEGMTNGSGGYTFQGTIVAGLEGSWTATWYVGGVPSTTLSYQIIAPPTCSAITG